MFVSTSYRLALMDAPSKPMDIQERQRGGVTLQAYFEDHFWALIDSNEPKLHGPDSGNAENSNASSKGGQIELARSRRRRSKPSKGLV